MSQFTTPPIRRSGGDINVYTGMLVVAFLVLTAGVVLLALRNIEHSGGGKEGGGIIKLID
jgi:uncharacterized membrane protein